MSPQVLFLCKLELSCPHLQSDIAPKRVKEKRRKEEWLDKEEERQVWTEVVPVKTARAGTAGIFPVRGIPVQHRPRHQQCEPVIPGSGREPCSGSFCSRYRATTALGWDRTGLHCPCAGLKLLPASPGRSATSACRLQSLHQRRAPLSSCPAS